MNEERDIVLHDPAGPGANFDCPEAANKYALDNPDVGRRLAHGDAEYYWEGIPLYVGPDGLLPDAGE